MRWELRSSFRRVCWAGAPPDLPADRPTIIYANHHNFFDGHFMWALTHRLLNRPGLLWMDEWDRFPFYAPLGVQPFPRDDAQRRAATIRRSIRRLHRHTDTVLTYFPEGELHPPEEGIRSFNSELFGRMDSLLPEAVWWPVAIHVTWWNDALPTALMAGGEPREEATGDEHAYLEALWKKLRRTSSPDVTVLVEGTPDRSDTWNFSFTRRFFQRYL